MIVDSSAIVAIVREEADGPAIMESILAAPKATMSAANLLETSIVIDGEGSPEVSERLDQMIGMLGIHITPFTANQARIARDAYRRFGKGSGHPARLNFGDCFAYALSVDANEPLLFKGTDFSQTDVRHI